MTPLILVTNDDGVHSPGIIALFEDMKKVGNAYIVAPDRERSAVSHALTLHRPLKADELRENVFSVNGTPTDCVVLAIHRILSKKPDIVVSGINMGANLGDDITYSGTVSAAIEGTILNVPSFAISLVGDKPFHYETAAAFATEITKYILSRSLPYDTLLNVNVPDMAKNEIKGIKITKQGKRIYDNAIRDIYSPKGDKYYWIGGGELYWERGEDMDSHAVQNSYVSVTPIHLDMTNYEALSDLIKHPI
ncbi:5'/3'-nucleotidase SurE [Thermodesulfovibrionales bacterium]|nr:5'/3'-nucleotidase SurE [Thermodesulfovibrionales bacterium]MCL0051070.1 5'/3'-nucleotidase SurE [Thermodesulfovibrionales bacterium]MCL0072069.1 5'/3'-nucleotidase SurE [Thermodesulfovibrionales bacterium]MCL0086037.1 5'/3'-nucleotidase SurE [Thermodesulfovibrionales bacterium]